MASVCVALRSFLAAVRSRFRFLLFLLPLFTRFIFSIELRFDDDRAPRGTEESLPLGLPLPLPLALFLCKKLRLLKEDARDRKPAKDEVDLGVLLCWERRLRVDERVMSKLRNLGYKLGEFCVIIPSHWPT